METVGPFLLSVCGFLNLDDEFAHDAHVQSSRPQSPHNNDVALTSTSPTPHSEIPVNSSTAQTQATTPSQLATQGCLIEI
jgi:hypothetical protein